MPARAPKKPFRHVVCCQWKSPSDVSMLIYSDAGSFAMSDSEAVGKDGVVARDLTAFQYNILVILSREPMYGLAIKRELEAYYDDEVNHGRLYPNLDDLVDLGLVAKSELDKRTNQYALTETGYETVTEQLSWIFSYIVTSANRADDLQDRIDSEL